METKKENRWNVPNALSLYRLLALPFIIYTIITANRESFILLLSINLVTDILDGLIARLFNLQTEFGAKLDSIADIGTYIMAFMGMISLEKVFVATYKIEFIILIAMLLIPQLCALIRFQRFPSFHLWSYKITGYLQGIFIFSYFVFGFSAFYFHLMLVVSCLAYLEELILVITLPKLHSNLKSIFLIQQQKRN
ncbi:CDP-alcohol phosphatidyltransferase family protein [Sphingobacterium sp. UDSM-2020]|uniref:CDP-alcohol phosphatidyltransferase family protein n=1 Tax=Sphingobacterium sp. UDSM-2020 TaxID=2795738 RepID=UPI001934D6B8|nr:CDP-alcohol phosphatidyltransferase family protein [Sphingobacterium sp. UDSM-2020]QQD13930.1 CDP-alcohol phosphatidyltransferase family protein [Sphingobacterium sp. UDSM-2020]